MIAIGTENLEKAHAIATRVEQRVKTEVPRMDRVLIHFEPRVRTHVRVAVPLDDWQGTLSPHFGQARCFALLSLQANIGELEGEQVVANPDTGVERPKGIVVAEWPPRDKIDLLILKSLWARALNTPSGTPG